MTTIIITNNIYVTDRIANIYIFIFVKTFSALTVSLKLIFSLRNHTKTKNSYALISTDKKCHHAYLDYHCMCFWKEKRSKSDRFSYRLKPKTFVEEERKLIGHSLYARDISKIGWVNNQENYRSMMSKITQERW
jgi:hypothetical protein